MWSRPTTGVSSSTTRSVAPRSRAAPLGSRHLAGLLALIVALGPACSDSEVGDSPVARCNPAGACDEAMFKTGLSAALGDAQAGATLFARECSKCHGEAGKGLLEARRVDMTSPAWQASMRDGTIAKTVRSGRMPVMPAFAFDDQQLRDLLAHIRKLEQAPQPTPRGGY